MLGPGLLSSEHQTPHKAESIALALHLKEVQTPPSTPHKHTHTHTHTHQCVTLASLCLSFLICKMGMIKLTSWSELKRISQKQRAEHSEHSNPSQQNLPTNPHPTCHSSHQLSSQEPPLGPTEGLRISPLGKQLTSATTKIPSFGQPLPWRARNAPYRHSCSA